MGNFLKYMYSGLGAESELRVEYYYNNAKLFKGILGTSISLELKIGSLESEEIFQSKDLSQAVTCTIMAALSSTAHSI